MTGRAAAGPSAVITGASGHIGGNLARALVDAKQEVRTLVRGPAPALEGVGAVEVAGDVLQPDSLERAFNGAEIVFNLAAYLSLTGRENARMERINIEGTRNVVRACQRAGVRRLVHFSSIQALLPDPSGRPTDETCALATGNSEPCYNRSKALAEQVVLAGVEEGLEAVIVSPTGVIGPHDYKSSPMGEALRGIARGSFPALVDGGFDWVDVRDVVQGTLAAAERGRPGERYLLGGHWLTMMELAGVTAQITGVPAPRWSSPMWMARLSAPVMSSWSRLTGSKPLFTSDSLRNLSSHQQVSHAKAAQELGYQARPLFETITDTLAWFREAGLSVGS